MRLPAEEQPITAATAPRLRRLLGTRPDSWLNMQRAVDLWEENEWVTSPFASEGGTFPLKRWDSPQ